jgi:hypothetical protein
MIWTATREELREDFALMQMAHNSLAPVECNHRIAFHDNTQEAVKVITPAPRFIAQLMAGGYTRHKRCIEACPDTGLPIFEGTNDLLDEMTYEQAVEYVAWRDMPPGTNHFTILHTDDLPRIDGDIDKARKFRNAWRLEMQS